MKKIVSGILICLFISSGQLEAQQAMPPVETKAPNSNYKPAFSGQTRIAGVKTITPYKVEKIAEKLGPPFAIVAMPDGRLMVTIKSGYMEIHEANGKLVKKITGLPGCLCMEVRVVCLMSPLIQTLQATNRCIGVIRKNIKRAI